MATKMEGTWNLKIFVYNGETGNQHSKTIIKLQLSLTAKKASTLEISEKWRL